MTFKSKSSADQAARVVKQKFPYLRYWNLRIWENLGWHCAFHRGSFSVVPCEDEQFKAYMASDKVAEFCTGGSWTTDTFFSNPMDAVLHELEAFEKFLNDYKELEAHANQTVKCMLRELL